MQSAALYELEYGFLYQMRDYCDRCHKVLYVLKACTALHSTRFSDDESSQIGSQSETHLCGNAVIARHSGTLEESSNVAWLTMDYL